MDDRLQLNARHLMSQQFLPASAETVRVKILHRDAAANYRQRWRVRARVASIQVVRMRCEFVRETARTWSAREEKATHAELRPSPDILRPLRSHRIRAAVRGRPAIPLGNFCAE